MSRVCWSGLLLLISGFSQAVGEEKEENHYAQFYGFTGVELYKLDKRGFALCPGDFDSDGLTDLIAVDNRASCLRVLRQRKEPENTAQRSGRYVNDLKSDWRFELKQISVDKQVAGLVAGDFDKDGKVDVAYIGTPDRLIIRYQPDNPRGEWVKKWSVRLPELAPAAWMIATGDLNGDERADIAVLGKNQTHIIYQAKDGTMEAPVPLINTSAQLSLIQIADLDGDGRDDLSYQATEGSERGLCARLQTKNGRLGPEVRFDLQQPRSVTLHDVDQQPGKEILTVDNRTGRVMISRLKKSPQDKSELPSRMLQFGIGEASGSKGRAIAIGDIDGDKLSDVVVTDPEKAQVLVYRQNGRDGLDTVETFPGLLGATDVCMVDTDGDKTQEVVLMSEKEAVVALSRFQDGRLTFPRTIARPLDGFQLAAILPLHDKASSRLAVCQKKGSGSSAQVKLQYLNVSKKEMWEQTGNTIDLPGTSIGTRGVKLLAFDADGNESQDLLVVPNGSGNKGVRVILSPKDADAEVVAKKDPLDLGISTAGALFIQGKNLFVAREAFARQMQFKDEDWTVADQFNAGESKAKIAGVGILNLDHEGDEEVVLIDTGVKKIRALRKSNGLYRPWQEVELGSLRFLSAHVADLDGDGQKDLLLFGQQQFSVLYSGRIDTRLEEVATYESNREDAYPADVIAGDLNGDGKIDLTVIDTSIDGVELLYFDMQNGLEPSTHFRVFEEKRLVSKSTTRGTEPREGLIVDVTDDGRADLVLLCHDRVIVYPQDEGTTSDSAKESE